MTAGVEVRGVTKSFGEGERRLTALHDVSLRIGMGEFVSVIGPSGCGKSTLLNIVGGLLRADSGTVTIDGESVAAASRDKKIGLVPQSPALLPWRTVRDNVRMPLRVNRRARGAGGREARDDDADRLLRAFGLGDALHLHPAELSGGMQQRVAIARAFVFDPTILLMDEPFSALDEINREQQQRMLLDFWQSNRKAVLFVTHSVPEAIMLSDRIVVMGPPGRIVETIAVDLPRRCTADAYTTPQFRDLEERVRGALRAQLEQTPLTSAPPRPGEAADG